MKTKSRNFFQFCIQLSEWVGLDVINANQAEILSLFRSEYPVSQVGAYLREKEGVK